MNEAYNEVITASDRDRHALFAETAARLGTAVQSVSRHYYDVHQLLKNERSPAWLENRALAADCATHARLFFGSNDLGLETAAPGTFTLMPSELMRDALRADYVAMTSMIFGDVPSLDAILASVEEVERRVNG